MTEHRTPSLAGSSGKDSPSLTGWGIADISGRSGETEMSSYKELLLDPRWQKKRLEVLESAGWACETCYDEEKTLHVHHLRYIKGRKPWEYERHELKALCADCHKEFHDAKERLDALVAQVDIYTLEEICSLAMGYVYASQSSATFVESEMDTTRFYAGAIAGMVADGKNYLLIQAGQVIRDFFPEQCFTKNQVAVLSKIASLNPEWED